MNKNNFKVAESISLISNMSFAIFVSIFVCLGIWIWKPSSITFAMLIGFIVLSFICNVINIFFAKKLQSLKLKGKPKELADLTVKYSYLIVFPIIFTICASRFRSSLWEMYINEKTRDMDKESDVVKENIKILNELKTDGFISNYKYEKLKDTYEDNLQILEKIENDKKDKR